MRGSAAASGQAARARAAGGLLASAGLNRRERVLQAGLLATPAVLMPGWPADTAVGLDINSYHLGEKLEISVSL